MATITRSQARTRTEQSGVATPVRLGILSLTIATAAIHAELGGLLFLTNAAGYAALALAMILPGPFATARWLVRLALAGFTAGTISAWFVFGARFPLAYLDKGLEVVLVSLIAVELYTIDGGPRGILARLRELATTVRQHLALGTAR